MYGNCTLLPRESRAGCVLRVAGNGCTFSENEGPSSAFMVVEQTCQGATTEAPTGTFAPTVAHIGSTFACGGNVTQ